MDEKTLLSVVVPVYNASKTLNRCVDSILNQTLQAIEVILVDDGSTDGVDVICDEYAKIYKQIRTIHQENKGPLSARIAGCRIARGEYISFVDSDDWIEGNMYEILCNEMLDADMIAAGIISTAEDGSIKGYNVNPYPDGIYSLHEISFLENVLFLKDGTYGGGAFYDGPWSKVFRKDLILKIINKLDVRIMSSEDWLFNSLYVLQCNTVKIISGCYYHYVTNSNSIGHTVNQDYLRQQNTIYDIMRLAVEPHPHKEVLLPQIQKKILTNLMSTGIKMGFCDEVLLPVYTFANNEIITNKRVVLFGAGKVGENYLIDWRNKAVNVVLWIDNRRTKIRKFGLSPVPPSEITNIEFDYVVCAIRGELAAQLMKKQLVELGVDEKKIIWEKPLYTVFGS